MLKRYWRSILAVVACLIVACLLWVSLRPIQPSLPIYKQDEARNTAYRPGGSECDPIRIRRLTGAIAVSETNRCRESAEQHRLQSSDLIQQTRAANAAEAAALLNYNQALISLAGTIVGFFTLIAAVLAALYAKLAAEAAERSITHSRDTSQQELRAYLAIEQEKVSREESGKKTFHVSLSLKNVGSTPANNVSIQIAWLFMYNNGGVHHIDKDTYSPLALASGATSDIERSINLPADESRAFRENKGHIAGLIEADFHDNFGEHWSFRQKLTVTVEGVANGKVYTDHCEHVKTEKVKRKGSRPASTLRLTRGPVHQER